MKKVTFVSVVLGLIVASSSMATTVWNPFANGHGPAPAVAPFHDILNWTAGIPGVGDPKGVFNVANAADAEVTLAMPAFHLVQGDGGPGGVLRIKSGGTISGPAGQWMSIGWNNTAQTIIETGGALIFDSHAWIGPQVGGAGVIDINGGTFSVGQMLGLGTINAVDFTGGTGIINVNDGGLLSLSNIHGGGTQSSIQPGSLIDITGTGMLTMAGDFVNNLQGYIDAGKIVGDGLAGNLSNTYDAGADLTTVVVPEPSTLALVGLMGLGLAARRKR